MLKRMVIIFQKLAYLPYNPLGNEDERKKQEERKHYIFYFILLAFVFVMNFAEDTVIANVIELVFNEGFLFLVLFTLFLILSLFLLRYLYFYPLTVVGLALLELFQIILTAFVIWHFVSITIFLFEVGNWASYFDESGYLIIQLILAASFILLIHIYRSQITDFFVAVESKPEVLINKLRFAIYNSNEKKFINY